VTAAFLDCGASTIQVGTPFVLEGYFCAVFGVDWGSVVNGVVRIRLF